MMDNYACATIFFHTSAAELVEQYEANADPANGYLTQLNDAWVMVDATATETAEWARQLQLATVMTAERGTAFTVVLVEEHWVLALAHDGQAGPVAVFIPDESKVLEQAPRHLLAIEKGLEELFPWQVDSDEVDGLFGELLDDARPAEEIVTELLGMLGCPPTWIRWSWYETIPQQLFLDPDLISRVTPLGEARRFWEE